MEYKIPFFFVLDFIKIIILVGELNANYPVPIIYNTLNINLSNYKI